MMSTAHVLSIAVLTAHISTSSVQPDARTSSLGELVRILVEQTAGDESYVLQIRVVQTTTRHCQECLALGKCKGKLYKNIEKHLQVATLSETIEYSIFQAKLIEYSLVIHYLNQI